MSATKGATLSSFYNVTKTVCTKDEEKISFGNKNGDLEDFTFLIFMVQLGIVRLSIFLIQW